MIKQRELYNAKGCTDPIDPRAEEAANAELPPIPDPVIDPGVATSIAIGAGTAATVILIGGWIGSAGGGGLGLMFAPE